MSDIARKLILDAEPRINIEEILHPNWDSGGRCHNWKNHIPDEWEDVWDQLHEDARLAMYAMASELANNEHWD